MPKPRHFTVTLDPPLAEAIHAYCEAESCTPAEAIRTIVRQFFASEPESGAIKAARLRAYNEVRVWTLTQANRFFKDLHTLLTGDLAGMPQPRKDEGGKL